MNCLGKILVFIAVFGVNTLFAGNSSMPKIQNFKTHQACFVENKGQLAASDIKYYSHQGGANVYCQPGKISFVFMKPEANQDHISEATSLPSGFPLPKGAGGFGQEKVQPSNLTTNRADLVLLNSNPSAQILPSAQQEYYENYYTTGNADIGITNVHTYKAITYKSIYPHIDMVLHAKEGGMKYEFVIYPGGKVSDIQIQWKGLERIKELKDSGIEYSLAFGKMEESAPYTYQGIANNVGAGFTPAQSGNIATKIESHFILKNNQISFVIAKYDRTKTLVIDPSLHWGTYFGGNGDELQSSLSVDVSDNVYITGSTMSTADIASSGAYQTIYGGIQDAFIAKFSTNGNRIWSTYFGGSGQEESMSVMADISGDVFITGCTGSTSDIATSGAYQTINGCVPNHMETCFIAKFSSSGLRVWGTYYGGSGAEIGEALTTDLFGNVYVTGITRSATGIATTGAYQTSYGGISTNYLNSFLAKFSSSGNLIWGTYFGGSQNDLSDAIAIDNSGNVYITGRASSTSGIASSGAYQTKIGGGEDVFIAKFSSSGSRLWSTYFGGNNDDQAGGIATDGCDNVYVTGCTTSTSDIATAGSYMTNNGGGYDAFLAKFSSVGNITWSTYYGGPSTDVGHCIAINTVGNIFIGGETSSTSGISSWGAYQSSFGGSIDAFLAEFSSLGSRIWSSYYGGSGYDYAYGIMDDNSDKVCVTGTTSSTSQIASSGAFQSNYNGNDDAFIAELFFPITYDAGILYTSVDSVCLGNDPVMVNLKNYGFDTLNFVTIGWKIKGKLQTPYQWSGSLLSDSAVSVDIGNYSFPAGEDTIIVWTSNPNGKTDSMPGNDTAILIFRTEIPNAHWVTSNLGSDKQVFTAIDNNYPASHYDWSFGDNEVQTGNPVTHVYQKDGQYKVGLTITSNHGCMNHFDSTIWVINHLNLDFFPNPFSTQAQINYTLPNPARVRIKVNDAIGREICTLLDKNQPVGAYTISYNAATLGTRPGMYMIVFMSDNNVITKQIIQLGSIFH